MQDARWRVDRRLALLKAVGVPVFALIAFALRDDLPGLVLAVVAAVVLAVYALRDVIAPVRLAADQDGVTVVKGFAGRRRIPWDEVERIRVDVRSRLGLRAELLEIDTGDDLHLFSSAELGAECETVARTLATLRTNHGRAG
jgi:hypothetical protein